MSRIQAQDWRLFERFAAEFLAVEYPSLRTMASESGDKGRDGELVLPSEEPGVLIQYSVTEDWERKISSTFARLHETFPKVVTLIYVTNKVIGPAADEVKTRWRAKKKNLDIRDASWFVERELTHPQRAAAAEELSELLVTPLVTSRALADRVATPLDEQEARIALLHLSLEGYDAESDKGLTKSCFESLVLSVLHDSSAESAVPLEEIVRRVNERLPAGHSQQVKELVESALHRLSSSGSGKVKQRGKTEDYHLSFSEQQRLSRATTAFLQREERVSSQLIEALNFRLTEESDGAGDAGTPADVVSARALLLKKVMETLLLKRGEAIVSAVQSGNSPRVEATDVLEIAESTELTEADVTAQVVAGAIVHVLSQPEDDVRAHLRSLADAYTLYAFLRQTPDVQKVFTKIFSDADLWLDTSIVLPALAEELLDRDADRFFQNVLRAARDAGIRLYVTDGIIEEVESHIHRCNQFSRTAPGEWRTDVPFLSSAYALSGRAKAAFPSWAEEFRGEVHPEEDVRVYLQEAFGIHRRSLKEEAESAPIELRGAVQELWMAAREKRRERNPEISLANSHRLVSHDVENCVGVIQRRKGGEGLGPMGYRAWWLTLDGVALRLGNYLKDQLGRDAPRSPALSPDFLTELLRLGPMRVSVEKAGRHDLLPFFFDVSMHENIPHRLVDEAEALRRNLGDVSERVVRRRVRDAIDAQRWRQGEVSKAGVRGVERSLKAKIEAQR